MKQENRDEEYLRENIGIMTTYIRRRRKRRGGKRRWREVAGVMLAR